MERALIRRHCAVSLQSCLTLQRYGLQPARLLCPWDSPGKNTGVGCHVLFQEKTLQQGLNSISAPQNTELNRTLVVGGEGGGKGISKSLYFLILPYAAATAKSHQSCPTLCNRIDGSPPIPVPGILQARRLEWVAISFSNA